MAQSDTLEIAPLGEALTFARTGEGQILAVTALIRSGETSTP
jgi:hypothetical protein